MITLRGLIAVAIMVTVFVLVLRGVALPQDFPNCSEFGVQISVQCCCSNGCCREVPSNSVKHLGDDLYRIVASGQIIKRTGWSPDGRTIRCYCDMIDGKWTVHDKAQTRCLYTPQPMM